MIMKVVLYLQLFILFNNSHQSAIDFLTPKNCSPTSSPAYYFNAANIRCELCSQSGDFQKQSRDGLNCECQLGYKYIKQFGGGSVTCAPCAPLQVTVDNGLYCVNCQPNGYDLPTKKCHECAASSSLIHLNQIGTTLATQECLKCTGLTLPSVQKNVCSTCVDVIKMLRASSLNESCVCPNALVDGVCFPGILPGDLNTSKSASSTSPAVPPNSISLYQIFPAGDTSTANAVISAYFSSQARSAVAFCSPRYANVTACQLLANLCTLQMQTMFNLNTRSSSTCAEFISLANAKVSTRIGFPSWTKGMPWLFYRAEKASIVLADISLSNTYTRGSIINLYVAAFNLSGHFLGFKNATANGDLQLCKDSPDIMRAGFRFGVTYYQSCHLNADDLFDENRYPLTFFDPYILFYDHVTSNGVPKLQPIPVLNRQLLGPSGSFINWAEMTNQAGLELTRRVFLVDAVSGKTSLTSDTVPKLVRYAKSIELKITPRGPYEAGKIFPPLLTITYASLKLTDDYRKGKTVKVSFSVIYEQSLETASQFTETVKIVFGVFAAIAFLYSILKTWFWSRRAGVLTLDIMLILKLLVHAAGAIANAFFLVIFGIAIYQLIFYKNQDAYLLTLPKDDNFLLPFLATALALKAIDLIHILAVQCTVDVYLIDWERPPATSSSWRQQQQQQHLNVPETPENLLSGDRGESFESEVKFKLGRSNRTASRHSTNTVSPLAVSVDRDVSVWRTIFAVNEWNELATCRKSFPTFTIFVVMLIMGFCGFENIASRDPFVNLWKSEFTYQSPANPVFRIAIIISIFCLLGLLEMLFRVLIWERFFSDPLRSFADLCSVLNVSVLILTQRNFGYYIHGHSPAGRADVGLEGLVSMLAAESTGLIPKRGISADSDRHTYRTALPIGLHQALQRLTAPLNAPIKSTTATRIETYKAINRFLISFISRDDAYGLRYRIVYRKAFEDLLDGEFDNTTSEGLFYLDNGNSFGMALFYGNEFALLIFEVLLFSLVDFVAKSVLFAGIITWFVMRIVGTLRKDLGKRNLVKKTLIDERFLN